MSEAKKCPKCGGEMELGRDLAPTSFHYVGGVRFRKIDDEIGDKVVPFYCKHCGFIEMYKEMKETK